MDQENKTREENIEVHFTESEDEEILNGDSPNNDRPDRYDFSDPKAIKKEIRKGLLASTEGYANAVRIISDLLCEILQNLCSRSQI
jgi:hypothetical protein